MYMYIKLSADNCKLQLSLFEIYYKYSAVISALHVPRMTNINISLTKKLSYDSLVEWQVMIARKCFPLPAWQTVLKLASLNKQCLMAGLIK